MPQIHSYNTEARSNKGVQYKEVSGIKIYIKATKN